MSNGYLPTTDAGLLAWAQRFSGLITADPDTYNLHPADAALLAGKVTAYQAALAKCEPAVRSKTSVITKNTAKANMVHDIRSIANRIYALPNITPTQLSDLGLTVRKTPSPIPPPSDSPSIDLVSVDGRTLTLRLHDGSPSRGKPDGVALASVFSFVGAAAPDDTTEWKAEGSTGKTVFSITFSPTLAPGATVWICAYWQNAKGESGPTSSPMSWTFGSANVQNTGTLKMAA